MWVFLLLRPYLWQLGTSLLTCYHLLDVQCSHRQTEVIWLPFMAALNDCRDTEPMYDMYHCMSSPVCSDM